MLNNHPCVGGPGTTPSPGGGCHCYVEVTDFKDITCLGTNTYSCTTAKGKIHEFVVESNNCGCVRKNTKCVIDGKGGTTT